MKGKRLDLKSLKILDFAAYSEGENSIELKKHERFNIAHKEYFHDLEAGHYFIKSENIDFEQSLISVLQSTIYIPQKNSSFIYANYLASLIIRDTRLSGKKSILVIGPNDPCQIKTISEILRLIKTLELSDDRGKIISIINQLEDCVNYEENELFVFILASFYFFLNLKGVDYYIRLYKLNTDWESFERRIEILDHLKDNIHNSYPNIIIYSQLKPPEIFVKSVNFLNRIDQRNLIFVHSKEALYKRIKEAKENNTVIILAHGVEIDADNQDWIELYSKKLGTVVDVKLNDIYSELSSGQKIIDNIILINCYNEKFNPKLNAKVRHIVKHNHSLPPNAVFQFCYASIEALRNGLEKKLLFEYIRFHLYLTSSASSYLRRI